MVATIEEKGRCFLGNLCQEVISGKIYWKEVQFVKRQAS
jgi:hypothetical protein